MGRSGLSGLFPSLKFCLDGYITNVQRHDVEKVECLQVRYTYLLPVKWFVEMESLMWCVFLDLGELEKKVQSTHYYPVNTHTRTRR